MLARNLRNVIYNYTDAQRKVRTATSNDAWGPPPALMHEIAELTHNTVAYAEIMPIIWKRLNDHGKNWRHVYKSLVLLEHLIRFGSERVVHHCKENIFSIQTLKDFQYVEDQKDQGHNVREKAKQLVALLKDEERLRHERQKAQEGRERFVRQAIAMDSRGNVTYGHTTGESPMRRKSIEGHDPYGGAYGSNSYGATGTHRSTSYNDNLRGASSTDFVVPASQEEEQLQMQIALAESQREAEDEERRRRNDDLKLRIALERSVSDTTEPQLNQLVDFSGGGRYEPGLFDPPTTASGYTLPPTTTSASTWDAPSSSKSPYTEATIHQHDPWNADSGNHYSAGASGNDPWKATASASSWQPVTTTQVQPNRWTETNKTATRDPDSALSLNFSDPWGANMSNNRTATITVNPSSTKIDEELSDIFGTANAMAPSNSSYHQMPYPSSDPWSTSSATNFPMPVPNSGSVSPPMSNFTAASASLLYPTVANSDNNGSNNSSPIPSALSASRKTPESFLGDKFRTLVNLDELVTDPKASTNPFGTTSRTPPNPFASANKPPTLEQLSVTNTPAFSNASALPPPLIPSTFNGNSTNGATFNSTNPFA